MPEKSCCKTRWLDALVLWALFMMWAGCGVGQAQERAPELVVGAGEIRLDGAVRVVNVTQRNLVIEANAFVLASGKTGQVKPVKTKTVMVQASTLLHVRGDLARKLSLADLLNLPAGVFAAVVGQDKGTGEALPAREVAIWDREDNGRFGFKDNLSPVVSRPVAPPVSPQVLTPVIPPPVVVPLALAPNPPQDTANPVDEGDEVGPHDVLRRGSFERLDAQGLPSGWVVPDGGDARVVAENGNHYAHITSGRPWPLRSMQTSLPVDKSWREIKIGARMRVMNFRPGGGDWEQAAIGLQYQSEDGQRTEYSNAPFLRENTDWTVLSSRSIVPPWAGRLILTLDLGGGARGEVDFDDVTVIPNPPVESWPLRPGLPEGTFEQVDARGDFVGWKKLTPLHMRPVEENGNHYLELTNDQPSVVVLTNVYKLDPSWQAFRARVRMRGKNLKVGPAAWQTAKLSLTLKDAKGENLKVYPRVPELRADSDWVALETTVAIPEDAVYLQVQPALMNATGTADFDDVQIEEVQLPNAKPRTLAITDDFWPGTFEKLDGDGNPVGWQRSRAGQVEVAAAANNHFLHLTNDNPQAEVFGEGRFRLDPTSRALHIKVRLRAQNLQAGPNPGDNAQLRYGFENGAHERVGLRLAPITLKQDADWVTLEARCLVPEGAFLLYLAPALMHCTGTLDVDDIQVRQLTQ